ncbi:ribosomal S12 methylthiotransferase, putative [Babesia ovata]|uniref:Ribosomal S12 methylthiotransferase, putative n=1 Tax=Babesia ovata TaxID=189622 RepID=A0A2H6KHZ8_9APIC|nr:ribosomal S12 methylthiotransferase, putative [Babesia ovata]GBE62614.1 ribosomal S12 methylthiotransferase, putative [Babesia ovata]
MLELIKIMTKYLQYGQADLGAVAALGGEDLFISGGIFFSFSQRTKLHPGVFVHVRVSELLGEFVHAGLEGVEEQGVVEAVDVGGGEGGDGRGELFKKCSG